MTTMATKDANSSIAKFHCKPVSQNLQEQSSLHTTSSRNNNSKTQKTSKPIIQFQKRKMNQNQSQEISQPLSSQQQYIPTSARGVRYNQKSRFDLPNNRLDEIDQDIGSKSFISHNRNKTISAFMTKDEFSLKQSEIFNEIQDLRSQLAIFLQPDNNPHEQTASLNEPHHQKQYSFMEKNDQQLLPKEELREEQEEFNKIPQPQSQQTGKNKLFNSQNMKAFQQMLDEIDQDSDVVMFKDNKGQLWEIIRHVSEADQSASFEDEGDIYDNSQVQELQDDKYQQSNQKAKYTKQRVIGGSFLQHAMQIEKANNMNSEDEELGEGLEELSSISQTGNDQDLRVRTYKNNHDEQQQEQFYTDESKGEEVQFQSGRQEYDDTTDRQNEYEKKLNDQENLIADVGKKVTTLSVISMGQAEVGQQLRIDTQEQVSLDQKWKQMQ